MNQQSNQKQEPQDDTILTPEEAREWLDDFLVKHQEEE